MSLKSLKDIVRCPSCGSSEIIYSCEPKCCFNHVCAECRTSFQLVTKKAGFADFEPKPPLEEPASGEPTAACAACESLRLGVVEAEPGSAKLICGNCFSLLRLSIEEVEAA